MNRLTIGLMVAVAVLAGALLFTLGRMTAVPPTPPQDTGEPVVEAVEGASGQPTAPLAPPSEPTAPGGVDSPAPSVSRSAPGDTAFTSAEQRLIARDAELETLCRGSMDAEEAARACEERDTGASMARLNAAGICWGREGEPNAAYSYHRCQRGSIGFDG